MRVNTYLYLTAAAGNRTVVIPQTARRVQLHRDENKTEKEFQEVVRRGEERREGERGLYASEASKRGGS